MAGFPDKKPVIELPAVEDPWCALFVVGCPVDELPLVGPSLNEVFVSELLALTLPEAEDPSDRIPVEDAICEFPVVRVLVSDMETLDFPVEDLVFEVAVAELPIIEDPAVTLPVEMCELNFPSVEVAALTRPVSECPAIELPADGDPVGEVPVVIGSLTMPALVGKPV